MRCISELLNHKFSESLQRACPISMGILCLGQAIRTPSKYRHCLSLIVWGCPRRLGAQGCDCNHLTTVSSRIGLEDHCLWDDCSRKFLPGMSCDSTNHCLLGSKLRSKYKLQNGLRTWTYNQVISGLVKKTCQKYLVSVPKD